MTANEVDNAMLSIRGLNSWYGTAQAVFEASMDVKAGEIVGLLGRNGAGKSSTFNSIMNIEVRRTGEILFEGKSAMRMRTDAIARSGIAWVPEDRRIFSGLTVVENLHLARFAARGGDVATVDELVDSFPLLGPLLKRKGDQLSGGEQQMVAVARALVSKPRLLLLDEPTEGLAPLIVEGLASAIAELPREYGVTILVAEQNLPFIKQLTSRVVVLETGRVVHAGPTAEFAADEEMQQRYLSVSVQA